MMSLVDGLDLALRVLRHWFGVLKFPYLLSTKVILITIFPVVIKHATELLC